MSVGPYDFIGVGFTQFVKVEVIGSPMHNCELGVQEKAKKI